MNESKQESNERRTSPVLVTGGAGFIGSNLVRHLLQAGYVVINVDKLTYAGHLESLGDVVDHPGHHFRQFDIVDQESLRALFEEFQPAAVLHLAAESHVDRSIDSPAEFIHTNIVGTFQLLQESRRYWEQLPRERQGRFRLVHCSTDEVFGSLDAGDPPFQADSRYDPHSPYSASKAAADHLVRAWHVTYGLPVIVTHATNNYGPCQYPEKLIPVIITRALADAVIPIFGDGTQVRDWIHVADHCRALQKILEGGTIGASYTIGASQEVSNRDLATRICGLLDRMRPRRDGASYAQQIRHVADRPGHDQRYAIDAARLRQELGWSPEFRLDQGLEATVEWYLANAAWCQAVTRRGRPESRSDSPISDSSQATPCASARRGSTSLTEDRTSNQLESGTTPFSP